MTELYNNHTYVKVFAGVILFLAFIFLIVLIGYQSGRNTVLCFGSALEPYGTMGEIIGEFIIVILFVIGTYLMVHYLTLTNVSKELANAKEYKVLNKINPPSKKQLSKADINSTNGINTIDGITTISSVNGINGMPKDFNQIQTEIAMQRQQLNNQLDRQAEEKRRLVENDAILHKELLSLKDYDEQQIDQLQKKLDVMQKEYIISDNKSKSFK